MDVQFFLRKMMGVLNFDGCPESGLVEFYVQVFEGADPHAADVAVVVFAFGGAQVAQSGEQDFPGPLLL